MPVVPRQAMTRKEWLRGEKIMRFIGKDLNDGESSNLLAELQSPCQFIFALASGAKSWVCAVLERSTSFLDLNGCP
jgi:hypothetical protein